MLSSYDTVGPTIIHLPEVAELFQYVCQTFNEEHLYRLPPPNLQVCKIAKLIIIFIRNFFLYKIFLAPGIIEGVPLF